MEVFHHVQYGQNENLPLDYRWPIVLLWNSFVTFTHAFFSRCFGIHKHFEMRKRIHYTFNPIEYGEFYFCCPKVISNNACSPKWMTHTRVHEHTRKASNKGFTLCSRDGDYSTHCAAMTSQRSSGAMRDETRNSLNFYSRLFVCLSLLSSLSSLSLAQAQAVETWSQVIKFFNFRFVCQREQMCIEHCEFHWILRWYVRQCQCHF